ncbi:hypothetical protein OG455_29070 [Kitasatospora sp. NBC_01287]|uniref:hypothetical protein n=1 Tax=Kitasatospora sp. NBC_01287 TaxID=2903573 RepID=UPI00225BB0C4|nr:hypothetical protein [Kitasatospora sp. NBC_01287]MCX4749515.1 hypothetical protein [Kitasatospora sp. NBC_01287]
MAQAPMGDSTGYVLELRCGSCPTNPVIEVYRNVDPRGSLGSTDTDRCLRCQERVLDRPHAGDHLCPVCRTECAECRVPISSGERQQGGICRRCRGACRICSTPMRGGACPECTDSSRRDPFSKVMRSFPDALLSLCGGDFHSSVAEIVRIEVQRVGQQRMVDRINRRWWRHWANLPLANNREGVHTPDQCAYSLVVPHDCDRPDCEDGWLVDADRNCPFCNSTDPAVDGPHRPVHLVLADAGAHGVIADPVRAQARAREIRQELRFTHGTSRSDRSPRRRKTNTQPPAPHVPAPYTLRERPSTWPPHEPGADDSPIIAARDQSAIDSTYEAAVERARREKAARQRS